MKIKILFDKSEKNSLGLRSSALTKIVHPNDDKFHFNLFILRNCWYDGIITNQRSNSVTHHESLAYHGASIRMKNVYLRDDNDAMRDAGRRMTISKPAALRCKIYCMAILHYYEGSQRQAASQIWYNVLLLYTTSMLGFFLFCWHVLKNRLQLLGARVKRSITPT